jgi:hypothetical protein
MTTRTVRACFTAWLLVLTALYYALPHLHVFTWGLLGFSCAAMIVVGVRRHRPTRGLPWYLIAVALAFFAGGDTIYYTQEALGLPTASGKRSTPCSASISYYAPRWSTPPTANPASTPTGPASPPP